MKTLRVGLIGLGTVGSSVARAVIERKRLWERQYGISIDLVRICDKRPELARSLKIDAARITTDSDRIIAADDIDLVIELIGGINPAKAFILTALKNGKHVVTANKALLAEEGATLFAAALRAGRELRFEASVGGGIPILKSLQEGFIANKIETMYGIVNGTANYILSRMHDAKVSFKDVLAEAQAKGFAEKDPSFDIDGIDSAHKLALLVMLGFGKRIPFDRVFVEGIRHITLNDIVCAEELGCVIKLLAIAKREGAALDVRVHPTMIPQDHLLASIKGAYNAIYVKGDMVGESLLYGQGAGGQATASAVISDIIDIMQSDGGDKRWNIARYAETVKVSDLKRIDTLEGRYYMRIQALDKPNVLAKIAHILGSYNISISTVLQKDRHQARTVPVVMTTHEAIERNVRKALTKIDALDIVKGKSVALRLEEL